MGGAGTVRAMSVGSDLFAAAIPVCPSMTPETFGYTQVNPQACLGHIRIY